MSALSRLNERPREIFRHIVESYLAFGDPVGSRHLARLLPMTLSPASVRNVMQDLEELGLIYAPHTSAGRLPTERGLRFFVDAMLEIGDIGEEERAKIEAQVKARRRNILFETVLSEAMSMLSGLTRSAGVVVTTKENARLKHIEFVRLDPERALAVLVAADGSVENRIVQTPRDLPASALVEAGNYLNVRIAGRTIAEAKTGDRSDSCGCRGGTRRIDRAARRGGACKLGRQLEPRPAAHRPRPGQSARKSHRARRPGAHPAALRRSRNAEGCDRPFEPRRRRRRCAHLHRLGEQALLALRFIDDRGALP